MAKTIASKAKKKLGGPKTEDGHRAQKVATVATVAERIQGSEAVLLTEYRGLKVGELADLRTALAKIQTDYKIVKNTLATIAVKQAGLDELVDMFNGPTAIAFVDGDVVKAAKEISDFAKRAPSLVLKGGVLAGKVLSEKDAKGLASLETREVMLAKIAGLFAAPLQRTAGMFAAPLHGLGAALAQLRDKMPAETAA
ncbi:MAG: 50S ribosomal protein L10 [Actinomycetota bacterium]|nr:50S ribosomal protein L10 [Actinomycetota bacterium]